MISEPRNQDDTSYHSPTILAKRSIYDSVFTNLFRIPEYTMLLYRVLHPEDTTMTQERIRIVTLENVLLNQPYNDLGFLAGDRFLILLEAQSTWSENILVRVLIYLAQTVQNYIIETGQNVYSSRKVTFPEPEFYVIFTGEREGRPEQLSLSQSFWGDRETALELRVKVLYGGTGEDVVSQYVAFSKIYKEQSRLHGRTQEAVLSTIQICKERNILKKYLESREKEVIDIMMTLFNQEYAVEAYGEEMKREGRQEGELSAKKNTALRLGKQKGMPIEVIAEMIDVSVELVRQWMD